MPREYSFSPFSSHVFHDSQVGNLIDSALVLEDKDGLLLLMKMTIPLILVHAPL